jgi:uncharacterized protein
VLVDVHAHVFSDAVLQRRAEFAERDEWFRQLNPPGSRRLASASRLIRTMDEAGVDVSCALGFGWADHALCVEQNDYAAEAVKLFPRRLLAFCTVQPRSGGAAVRELERCARLGFRGVGELFPDGQGFSLADRATLAPVLEACDALGLVFLVHASEPLGRAYPGKGETTPQKLLQLAQLVNEVAPSLTVICAHLGGGLPFYELMPEVRALTSSLYFDTGATGYLYEPTAVAHVAQIAPDRLLFGSDYPVIGTRRMVDFVRAAQLPPEVESAVLGGTAARLLGLKDLSEPSRSAPSIDTI